MTDRELLCIAISALKWFIGRQERGRVNSHFSVWVFQTIVEALEARMGEEVVFDFDVYDDLVVAQFEAHQSDFKIER